MVKAIVLDVDGVIVGSQTGINFPLPHTDVTKRLQEIRQSGIPVILCTAKFGLAIHEIIKQAKLNNPHITDGGALIIDPLDNVVIKKYTLPKEVVKRFASLCIERNIYIELYTPETYYMQKNQLNEFTPRRTKVLQAPPTAVDSIVSVAENEDVIKIIVFADNDDDKARLQPAVDQLGNTIHHIWSSHPFLHPYRPCIITSPTVSRHTP